MKKEEEEGVRPLYRPRDWQNEQRRIDKQNKNHNWSAKGGHTAPIFVPSTPGGELAAMLREVAGDGQDGEIRFKVNEIGGRTIKREVQRSNPTATGGCADEKCIACKNGRGEGGCCRKNNVTYEIECNLCQEDGWTGGRSVYVGESARNLYTRGLEHSQKYEGGSEGSFLTKHQLEKHRGTEAKFSARVTGTFQDCLSRQVSEGVFIRRSDATLMNTKSEWHQPPIWRVQSELLQG